MPRGICMRTCLTPHRQPSKLQRIVGIALMAAGGLMLLILVPHWVWCGFLAVPLISEGFLLYRFWFDKLEFGGQCPLIIATAFLVPDGSAVEWPPVGVG